MSSHRQIYQSAEPLIVYVAAKGAQVALARTRWEA
jgi:hypothetical protein